MPSFTTPLGDFDKYIPNPNPWRLGWPNSADMNFNFNTLLSRARSTAIGQAPPNAQPSIAIVGAGIAGMTVARELFRSGYVDIDIFEATDRIGGRDYSVAPQNVEGEYNSVFELGAMRLPFFPDPQTPNSAMGFYADVYGISTQNFPDPGVVTTGIYVNNGLGPDMSQPFAVPEMIIWQNGEKAPPTETLSAIYERWVTFANIVKQELSLVYVTGDDSWVALWHEIANNYSRINFRQLAQLPSISKYDSSKPGYFGGLNLNNEQLETFYLIGAGDGSWGAFFDVGALYIFRTLLCGFGVNHQLIKGRFSGGTFNPGPYAGDNPVPVSDGGQIQPPIYRGVQSFAECMFFLPANHSEQSVYDAVVGKIPQTDVNFYSNTSVVAISGDDDVPKMTLTYQKKGGGESETAEYDYIVLTPTTWANQLSIDITGLSAGRLPFNVRSAMTTAHWIKSCKICVATKEKYWENGKSRIPQVLVTDTFLQDVYAYSIDENVGAVVLSYTWEDDASKLLSYTDDSLINKCIDKADSILMQSTNINEKISDYLVLESARVIHWALEPSYHGCANLYRPGRWTQDYELLAFNQNFSANGIYFAGEACSVEGGWTEPAIRSGLDAVVHIVKNSGGKFLNGFDFDSDYLKLDTNFKPVPPNL